MIKKTLKINGVERILILDKDETLAQVLREHLLLTGCKIGCGEGHCGACNVIMNGKVTRSCIYKMSRVPDNAEITTIEGVGTISDMHPIQVAWMAYGCAQWVSVHQVLLFQQRFFSIIIRALPVKK